MSKLLYTITLLVGFSSINVPQASGFGYIFAGDANGIDLVTHPIGYVGTGGVLNVTVGIDATSVHAADMITSVQNVINTFNSLNATTGNLVSGGLNNIPSSAFDFESVLLHELGHSLGLSHVNAASESGLAGNQQNYTKATDGANNIFDLDAGIDGVIGSSDDQRGDDVNLNYFKKSDNNPFTIASVVDSTTYSRDLADLPGLDSFSANSDRSVAALLGFSATEGAMQQGTFIDESQRTLVADDVAGILYAASGLDEIAGTADDYTLNLSYAGLTSSADILIDFDNSQTGFAVSQSSGVLISADHASITTNQIFMNTGYNWFFNDVSNAETVAVPEPTSFAMMGLGAFFVVGSIFHQGWVSRVLRRPSTTKANAI